MAEETTKKISTELDLDIESFTRKANQAADSAEDIQKQIDALKEKLSQMGATATKEGKKTENALNGMVAKFLGFRVVSSVIKSSWTNIVEMDTAVTSLNYTLGESSGIIQDFAKNYTNALSISEKAILSMGSTYATMLKNIVDSNSTIANVSTKIIQQIERITGATGRSTEEISNRYQQLIRGNLGAFRDLGIDTRREYLELTDTFKELANGRQWEELTQNERTQIALIETMTQVDATFGESADSLQGRLGKLEARTDNLKTSIGSLLAVATPLIDFMSTVATTAADGFQGLQMMGDGVTYVVVGGAAFVAFAPSIVKGLTSIFTGSVKAATGFMLLGTSILTFALIAASVFKKSQDSVSESTEGATDAIEDEIAATEKLEDARTGLMGIDEINTLRSSGSSTSIEGMGEEFSSDKSSEWIDSYLEGLGDLQAGLNDTTADLQKMEQTFNNVMLVVATLTGLVGILTLALRLLRAQQIKNTQAELAALEAQLAENTARTQGAAAAGQESAALGTNTTAQNVNTASTHKATAAEWLHNASLATKIGLVTLGIGALAIVGGAIALGVIMNQQASKNKMARGGVVNQATTATIGEGVYHEAVIPLGNSPEWNDTKQDLAEYLVENGGGGATRVDTVINLNGREIAKATSEDIHDDWKRRGWI